MSRYEDLLRDMQEKQRVAESTRATLAFDEGERLFKFLFKKLGVGQLPASHLRGEDLHEEIGFLRAGKLIQDILLEADPNTTTKILIEIEQEKLEANQRDLLADLEKERNNVL